MTTIRERILVWLITSMLAVGAWLLLTSFTMGANNFPVPVLAVRQSSSALRTLQSMGERTAREGTRTPAPKAGTLVAGNSFRSRVSSDASHNRTSLAQAPRLASSERVPAGSFLDAIERIESNGNTHAVGDKGRARGPYQFWAVAWSDVSLARSKQGLSVADYWSATNRVIARSYAQTYLGMLNTYLTTALKRQPTHTELYAAWNLGPSGFKRRGFSLSRCPESTRRAAVRINSLLALLPGGAASQGQMRIGASVGLASR